MEKERKVVVRVSGLKKNYGKKEILKGIDLEVYEGEIIGYIGPNGAGKSTTVKLILGLVDDYVGDIEIFGANIANSDVSYKKHIGYVPEIAELYESLTAREYLTFIGELYGLQAKQAESKAEALMDIFQIKDALDNRISSFSKGMKQKVLLISSMLHDPEILFLDEPLSGLDANSVMIVKEILAQMAAQGKTIFYSSHIMEVVEKISDRIVLIAHGEIVANDTFEGLSKKSAEGSLEGVFNKLTGFFEYKELAERFVEIVRGGKVDEVL